MLASLLYPYDDDAPAAIDKWLDELDKERCIRRYALDSDQYIEICNWLKHQKIDKPSPSKLPKPPEANSENGSDESRKPREDSRSITVGREGKGEEGNRNGKGVHPRANGALGPELAKLFEAFWSAYPKRKAKGDAEKAWAKLKPDSELAERIMTALRQAKTSPEWVRDAGRYIPHPASWLNGKRWEDDIAARDNGTEFGELV
jgi:hypothetical protein